MGLTRQEVEGYESCTCLVKVELDHLFDKFAGLVAEGEGTVKFQTFIAQEEFRYNPFRHRLCQIFSSQPPVLSDGTPNPKWGDLTFDEFVDLYNVLSPRASRKVKVQTAFRMYDFDCNGYLGMDDLQKLLTTLATPPHEHCYMDPRDRKAVCERVMRDCDTDGNGRLSYSEFDKLMSRIPEFTRRFSIITTFTQIRDGKDLDHSGLDAAPFDTSAAASQMSLMGKSMKTFSLLGARAITDAVGGTRVVGVDMSTSNQVAARPGTGAVTGGYSSSVTVGGKQGGGAFPKHLSSKFDSPEWEAYLREVYEHNKTTAVDKFGAEDEPSEPTVPKGTIRKVVIFLGIIILLALIAAIVVAVTVSGPKSRRLTAVLLLEDRPKDEV